MLNKYTVKTVKTFIGQEGHGFNANLYRNNKKVAFVRDDASGGSYAYDWVDYKEPRVDIISRNGKCSYEGTPEEKILQDIVTALPKIETELDGEPFSFDPDMDTFIGDVLSEFEEKKQIKKWSKTKTVFLLKGEDPKEGYHTATAPFSTRVLKYLKDKYADSLAIVYNSVAEPVSL